MPSGVAKTRFECSRFGRAWSRWRLKSTGTATQTQIGGAANKYARHTKGAPSLSRGAFFFILSLSKGQFLTEGIASGNAESTENQANQTVGGKHDEHPEESPEDFPLALVTTSISSLGGDKLEDTPEEH